MLSLCVFSKLTASACRNHTVPKNATIKAMATNSPVIKNPTALLIAVKKSRISNNPIGYRKHFHIPAKYLPETTVFSCSSIFSSQTIGINYYSFSMFIILPIATIFELQS
jgi:hypothetical protein